MTQKLEVYKCDVCGNIVEMVHAGKGELVCCGQPMKLQQEKTEDQGKEKHVPVVEKTAAGVAVKVGSIPHPMEEKHYIEWVELITAEGVVRKFLAPGQKPEALFDTKEAFTRARQYCNIHGLWTTK